MRIIFDAAAKASSRRVDDNGFLHVTACPITSHGVFDYARCEMGGIMGEGDPNELFKVLRDQSTITLPEFIASCQNLPLVDDHTYVEGVVQDGLGEEAEGVDPAKKGVCGVLTNVRYDEESGWVVGDLAVYARQMIRQILAGQKTELSLGFTCVFALAEGASSHVAVQTNMMGNHLALVDRARVPGARVLDSAFPNSSEDENMSKDTNKGPAKVRALDSSAVDKLRELLLPALQQFLSEEAAEPAHQDPAATDPAVAADPAVDPAAEPAAVDPAVAADPAADPAAAVETDDGDDALVPLLQQLLAALQAPAAAGDEDPVEPAVKLEEETPAGDNVDPEVESSITMDAMFVAVAERDKIYGRVSKVVGAFDHAAMTAEKVAQYGVKKLGLKCVAGQEMIALDAYLAGAEAQAAKATKSVNKVGDGMPSSTELDAYLAGKKL